ncbi:MAG: capsular polysaccharide biosynthesis protein [Lachnospiraceae bacterium]|nr:capsular polysaccharide biosynthesis protein [Lachnospiraceae bacterium]
MIDVHTHILPGIDDGSRSSQVSRELLEESARQGVSHICATPHFYAHRESFDHFLEKRERALEKVLSKKKEWGPVPAICVGAEVYYFPGMGRAERLAELCYRGTDLLLVEMPFDQWTAEVVADIRQILEHRDLRVIIAHIERYYGFQKDKRYWEEVFSLPVIPQLNAGPFLRPGRLFRFSERDFCLKYIKEKGPVLLGSDCHNMESRCPNLQKGRAVIEEKIGGQALQETDTLGEKLLLGDTGAEWYE